MKVFNTTAVCIPSKHYMVDISENVSEIKKMVDAGKYFTINRARQYGKTTTIVRLAECLRNDYYVLSLDFQGISDSAFENEKSFVKAFSRVLLRKKHILDIPAERVEELNDYISRKQGMAILDELFATLSDWCEESLKPIVMIIDEVDSATNNQVFLDFLAQLRLQYLEREQNESGIAFQSVILAGVSDIKHLKSKIRDDKQEKVNSPWNIAADFDVDMSLSEEGIRMMLNDYEADHHTGMDTDEMAHLLRDYTAGYPFLVSRICQIIDEKMVPKIIPKLSDAWTKNGFNEAIKILLSEKNTLFESLMGKLINYPKMREALHSLLMEGVSITYNALQESIVQMEMYGFIRNDNNKVAVSNRIFETLLYNLFLSDEELNDNRFSREGAADSNIFVEGNTLNVRKILEHFIQTYHDIYGSLRGAFKEKDGRELFLLYLKPIINGTGNYYVEAQTRDQTRTDVIIDYLGKQYIIELKIWRGQAYNERGENQLCEYLDYFHLNIGYMLSFNFNNNKVPGVKEVKVGDKVLYEGVV